MNISKKIIYIMTLLVMSVSSICHGMEAFLQQEAKATNDAAVTQALRFANSNVARDYLTYNPLAATHSGRADLTTAPQQDIGQGEITSSQGASWNRPATTHWQQNQQFTTLNLDGSAPRHRYTQEQIAAQAAKQNAYVYAKAAELGVVLPDLSAIQHAPLNVLVYQLVAHCTPATNDAVRKGLQYIKAAATSSNCQDSAFAHIANDIYTLISNERTHPSVLETAARMSSPTTEPAAALQYCILDSIVKTHELLASKPPSEIRAEAQQDLQALSAAQQTLNANDISGAKTLLQPLLNDARIAYLKAHGVNFIPPALPAQATFNQVDSALFDRTTKTDIQHVENKLEAVRALQADPATKVESLVPFHAIMERTVFLMNKFSEVNQPFFADLAHIVGNFYFSYRESIALAKGLLQGGLNAAQSFGHVLLHPLEALNNLGQIIRAFGRLAAKIDTLERMAIDDNVSPELFNATLQPLIDARAVLDNQISAAIQTVMQDFKSRSREGQMEMIGQVAGEALATIFGPNVIAGGLRAAARTDAAANIIAQTTAFADKTLKAIELLATGTTRARGIPAGNIHKVLKAWNENGHILEIIELIEPGTSHGLAKIPGMSKAVTQTACTELRLVTSLPTELQATGSALIETAKNINARTAEITGTASAATAGPTQTAINNPIDAQHAQDARYATVAGTGERCRIPYPESKIKAMLEWAPHEYTKIRQRTDDLAKIAKNTNFPEYKIQIIKNHLFYNEHIFDGGKVAQFGADHEIAAAWYRLIHGDFIQNDLQLLEHEYFEAEYEKLFQVTYEEAHRAAQGKIPSISGKPWDAPNLK